MAAAQDADLSNEPTILGHPRALFVLFFAELWERFCYYGMRALLALYVVAQFQKPQAEASLGFGAFTALVYATGIFGGSIADRFLGYRRSIILGGTIMAIGLFVLMIPSERAFLYGLATIIVGNGLFKPNISTLVGKLYKPGDPRRDGGFTIFYMGINIGAFLAPIACQAVSAAMGTEGHPDYRYGFLLAGIGMILGIVTFGIGGPLLRGKGDAPANRQGWTSVVQIAIGCALAVPAIYALLGKQAWTGWILFSLGGAIILYLLKIAFDHEIQIRQRMMVLVLLLLCNVTFWMCFEQAGNSLNFFARDHINALTLGNWHMPFEWFQSVNAIMIVALGPLFAAMWVFLDRRGWNPSIPAKFGLGLIQVGLGFALLMYGIQSPDAAGKIPWYMLTGLYLIHTSGELCLSPVGLSMVTKLAPEKVTGMVMGSWFISIAVGNHLAGLVSAEAGDLIDAAQAKPAIERIHYYTQAFTPILWTALGVGGSLFLLSRLINKWMHGVK
jgi:proton-dependent oligopeptide transporter, POT family